jgi:hypothetical protein
MANRIGPRMREACWLLAGRGGECVGIHWIARAIGYGPGGFYRSARYGYAVVNRCIRAGLVERLGYTPEGVRIRLTDSGYRALSKGER